MGSLLGLGLLAAASLTAAGCYGNLECKGSACVRSIKTPADAEVIEEEGSKKDASEEPVVDAAVDAEEPLPDAPDAMVDAVPLDAATDTNIPPSDAGVDAAPADTALCGSLTGAHSHKVDRTTNHCYVVWATPVSGDMARSACVSRGGHLATVTSAAENLIVRALLDSTKERHWIGLVREKEGAAMKWVTGEAISFVNWGPDEPGTDYQLCGAYYAPPMEDGWHDLDCSIGLRYLCEKDPSSK